MTRSLSHLEKSEDLFSVEQTNRRNHWWFHSSPPENGGWKTSHSYWGFGNLFRGELLNLQGVFLLLSFQISNNFHFLRPFLTNNLLSRYKFQRIPSRFFPYLNRGNISSRQCPRKISIPLATSSRGLAKN